MAGRMEDSTVQKPHILTTFFFDLEWFRSGAQESFLETSIPNKLGTKPQLRRSFLLERNEPFKALRMRKHFVGKPPPLRKHTENQENDGQTGSQCLDKAVLAHNAQYQKNVCLRKPAHTSPSAQLSYQGTRTQCAGKFQQVVEGAGGEEPGQNHYMLVRPPNLAPVVMGVDCGLGRGHGQKGHDAQSHAHSSSISNE